MIRLSSIRSVCVIGPRQNPAGTVFALNLLEQAGAGNPKLSKIPTDNVTIPESEGPPFEALGQTSREMEALYDQDPNTVFIIDDSDKAASALARLLEGQWNSFPWSAHTIVI